MEDELRSHDENNTWTIVPKPKLGEILKNRWVYRIKVNPEGNTRYKARLVVKRFQQQDSIDYDETFASICRHESIRVLLAIRDMENLRIVQCDVKTALLHGDLEETIYMQQPEGYEGKDKVCILNKSLYRLKQVPRCWSSKLTKFLEELNFKATTSDPCVFIGIVKNMRVYFIITDRKSVV